MDGEKRLEQARERVIDAISQNMHLYGVTESVGRLYGALYFQEEPMTLDEMKEELGMSKTSMSTSVRNLVDLKMVGKVWRKGVRKDLYQAEPDWYQTFIDFFTIKWRAGVTINVSAMEKSLAELQFLIEHDQVEEQVKAQAQADIEKLTSALEYYDWLNRLVDSFESKEIFKFIPKNGSGA
ncbi:choline uptake/conversion transcriptional regulator CudC [Neobacillus mesonae]|uniref:HTH-type transcriptional regulator n=1 Tax=Neobacillus mesonae TaxID=1193713 RepID=A0A3Q9QV70_9BACI|nr:GbsR/MarR family transcriptional regulator [Neobacillus mesonae]AZU64027.1 GbsR/MarR family transcriptional regulator [Neobacillus mesonae]MED4206295.1 GbsR/MarR family transcriptional regulator [Neobacillus mesonae]